MVKVESSIFRASVIKQTRHETEDGPGSWFRCSEEMCHQVHRNLRLNYRKHSKTRTQTFPAGRHALTGPAAGSHLIGCCVPGREGGCPSAGGLSSSPRNETVHVRRGSESAGGRQEVRTSRDGGETTKEEVKGGGGLSASSRVCPCSLLVSGS